MLLKDHQLHSKPPKPRANGFETFRKGHSSQHPPNAFAGQRTLQPSTGPLGQHIPVRTTSHSGNQVPTRRLSHPTTPSGSPSAVPLGNASPTRYEYNIPTTQRRSPEPNGHYSPQWQDSNVGRAHDSDPYRRPHLSQTHTFIPRSTSAPNISPPITPPWICPSLPRDAFATTVTEAKGNMTARCSAACLIGLRPTMEDNHVMDLNGVSVFAALFDGHGGRRCADYLSSYLPMKILNSGSSSMNNPNKHIQDCCLYLDEEYRKLYPDDRSGATAAFVIGTPINSNEWDLILAHVGDARILIGQDGRCIWETQDHSPHRERDRITAMGGFVDNNRVDGMLGVGRAFGDLHYKNGLGGLLHQKVIPLPDTNRMVVRRGDVVILACDGVFERMTNAEVVGFVMQNRHQLKELTAAGLCQEALRRGSTDNITAMVLEFEPGTNFSPSICVGPYLKSNHNAKQAIKEMARMVGVGVPTILEIRFHNLINERKTLLRTMDPSAMELVREIDEELLEYGEGPVQLVGINRSMYFENLARQIGD
eukprot:NODE_1371_length_1986_cov_81.784219_g1161_i0.p1 GENE.NODE_1371_length_1986_cov_81.784219_g1161_i0~~NODE_1371_length_1986_cov_81.784219_g1161_i0.p1  ORF type:complete len:535 (+),score=91.62 NODE_1371_length_1986_cov_81.784219_g1161_i0:85-1689(+)